jgi:hypothetical protein
MISWESNMIGHQPILASGEVGLIIIVVISVVAWIARKVQESNAAKRQEQQNTPAREQAQEDQEVEQEQPPMRPTRREAGRAQSRQIGSMPPSPPIMPQSRATGAGAFQTQGQRYAGGQAPSAYRRTPPPPVPRPGAAAANVPPILLEPQLHQGDLARGVDEEMERQRQRMQQERSQREERMATLAPQEADTAALISRLVHIRPASLAAGAARHGESSRLLSLLKNGAGLRSALIHYEIFSPPKSMRKGQDIWDA